MAVRISGLVSGLDTDSIVQELVSAYSKKKDSYVKKQTSLEWTMDAWKEVNTKVYGFYTSTLSSMRMSSSYNLRTATISNSSVAQVSASAGAVTSTQTLAVKQLAASGYMTGGKVTASDGSSVKSSTKLSELGITEGTIMLGNKEIELNGDMSLASLSGYLKGTNTNASFDEATGRFFISSKTSGENGEFTVTAGDSAGLEALSKFGLLAFKDVNGNETAEMKKYRELADAGFDSQAEIDQRYNKAKWTVDSYTKSIQEKVDNANSTIESLNKSNESLQEQLNKLTADDYKWEDDYDSEDKYNEAVENLTKKIEENTTKIENQQKIVDENQPLLDDSAALEAKVTELNADILNDITGDVTDEVAIAKEIVAKVDAGELTGSTDSARITAQDSIIKLNGATFTGNTNTFSINGLNINAMATTVTTSVDENGQTVENDNAVTISTAIDTQGIYDKIKSMFTAYNEMIAYMDGLYYADSADGYEPLTDEEMEEMTDTQIEKWEEKVKAALLRKDSTLSSITSALKNAMLGTSVTTNGVTLSLSSFGIATGSYFSTGDKERSLFHIDGNKDDSLTASNEDKLMAMISSDPDAAIEFFQTLSTNLYDVLTKKMQSSSLSSAFTIYNDKQMQSQYSDYTDRIEDWEERVKDQEDYYYKKFSKMEQALSNLQSTTNSLSNLFGSSQ